MKQTTFCEINGAVLQDIIYSKFYNLTLCIFGQCFDKITSLNSDEAKGVNIAIEKISINN